MTEHWGRQLVFPLIWPRLAAVNFEELSESIVTLPVVVPDSATGVCSVLAVAVGFDLDSGSEMRAATDLP